MISVSRYLIGVRTALVAVLSSIISGAFSIACATEPGDAFVPISESTKADPAGAQLMIISIGILVTMVFAIFGVTIYYMVTAGKKKRPASGSSSSSGTTEGASDREEVADSAGTDEE